MMDSATNNDTAMTHLQGQLVSMFGEDAGVITSNDRRLRCFGHCLNLAAKQLVHSDNMEALESQRTDLMGEKAEEAEFLHWRKAGALGKCTTLRFIKRSDQRREAFRKIQTDTLHWDHSIVPRSDNDTRWTSKFACINDILNLQAEMACRTVQVRICSVCSKAAEPNKHRP